MPERLNGIVSKTIVGKLIVGSNPTLSAVNNTHWVFFVWEMK